ncbi:hypothetical protein PFISCL1PPCAC_4671, partial [Pristionchus fissidentatus]
VGHALGTIVFAYYTLVTQKFRNALILGRILSASGCILYLSIEFYSKPLRRFIFLTSFLLNALGEGSTCVIRSYVPRTSTGGDRQTAYSLVSAANMLAIICGPASSIVFT